MRAVAVNEIVETAIGSSGWIDVARSKIDDSGIDVDLRPPKSFPRPTAN